MSTTRGGILVQGVGNHPHHLAEALYCHGARRVCAEASAAPGPERSPSSSTDPQQAAQGAASGQQRSGIAVMRPDNGTLIPWSGHCCAGTYLVELRDSNLGL